MHESGFNEKKYIVITVSGKEWKINEESLIRFKNKLLLDLPLSYDDRHVLAQIMDVFIQKEFSNAGS